jgi:hypothetical protein
LAFERKDKGVNATPPIKASLFFVWCRCRQASRPLRRKPACILVMMHRHIK